MSQKIEHNNAAVITQSSETQINYFQKIGILLLITGPILQTYGWGMYNFALLSTLAVSIVFLLLYWNRTIQAPLFLVLYILYAIVIHMITADSIWSAIPFVWGSRLLIVFMFYGCFERKYALRLYKFIAIICIVFFYLQELTYNVSGTRILGIFSRLPFAISTLDIEEYADIFESANRSASFFSEPAYFAQFILPLLAIELYNCRKIIHYIFVIILVITLLLLRSGCGMVGLIIIFLIFPIYTIFNKNYKVRYKILILFLIVIGIFGTTLYLQTENGSQIKERFENIDSSGSNGSDMSAYIRIFRGYSIFADFSTKEKIFGTDNQEVIHAHTSKMFIKIKDDDDSGGYLLNAFQSVLVRTGLIGVLLWSIMLLDIFKNSDIEGKTVLLCYIGLMFTELIYFSSMMYIYFLMASSRKR